MTGLAASAHMAAARCLAGVVLAGCALGSTGDVATARRLADEYLSAVGGDTPDRGWSLLLPDSRRAYADRDQYLQLTTDAEWDRFSWRFADSGDYCEDGGVYCVVRIEIHDTSSIPDFLLTAPESGADDLFWTLRLDDEEASPGNAEIVVYFSPGGPRGILLGGG